MSVFNAFLHEITVSQERSQYSGIFIVRSMRSVSNARWWFWTRNWTTYLGTRRSVPKSLLTLEACHWVNCVMGLSGEQGWQRCDRRLLWLFLYLFFFHSKLRGLAVSSGALWTMFVAGYNVSHSKVATRWQRDSLPRYSPIISAITKRQSGGHKPMRILQCRVSSNYKIILPNDLNHSFHGIHRQSSHYKLSLVLSQGCGWVCFCL